MLDNGKRRIVGINIADISNLNSKYQNNPNVEIISMDTKKLKFEKGSFDICTIMSNTIGLFKDPSKILNECRRITKPQGKIIISTYEKDAEYVLNERKEYFIKTGHEIKIKGFQIKIKDGVCVCYFTFDKLEEIFKKSRLEFKYYPLTRLGCLWVAEVSKN